MSGQEDREGQTQNFWKTTLLKSRASHIDKGVRRLGVRQLEVRMQGDCMLEVGSRGLACDYY